MTSTFNEAEGRVVVAADTATDVGEVKGFIVDPTVRRIEGLHVSGSGRKADIITWEAIQSFGQDAVIVDTADAAERAAGHHEKQAAKGNIVLRGARVLTTDGFEAGTVQDVMFDTVTGALIGVQTDQGTVDGGRLRAIGSYALIVNPA